MNFTKLLFTAALAFSLGSQAAGVRHMHSSPVDAKTPTALSKKLRTPGMCEIEIVNSGFEPVHVSGQFLDGEWLQPFDIYPMEYPHYISLYYYGCQPGMYLTISTFSNYVIYNSYTLVYQTVSVFAPMSLQQQSVVKVQPKAKK